MGSLGSVASALLIVIAAIFGAAWLLRRAGRVPGAGSGPVRIVGGVSLSPRERVLLIEVGGTQVLVGHSPGRINSLHVLDHPVVSTGAIDASAPFAAQLAGWLSKRGQ